MKLTIPKPPVTAALATPSVASSQQVFAQKLAALRAATGRTERFVSLCACAVHDRPFAVMYERSDPRELFVITGIYRDGEGDADMRGSASSARRKEVSAREIDATGWRCPHCAAEDLNVVCGNCGLTVCGGRTKTYHGMAPVFNCRASCGSRGTLEDAQSINGVEPIRSRGPTYRTNPHPERLALPAPGTDVLRLPAPGRPRLK